MVVTKRLFSVSVLVTDELVTVNNNIIHIASGALRWCISFLSTSRSKHLVSGIFAVVTQPNS
jgi:hypothetical protein